jgi:hypothetical protein
MTVTLPLELIKTYWVRIPSTCPRELYSVVSPDKKTLLVIRKGQTNQVVPLIPGEPIPEWAPRPVYFGFNRWDKQND